MYTNNLLKEMNVIQKKTTMILIQEKHNGDGAPQVQEYKVGYPHGY
jgi:formylmethanofuran dehydrogenase subunit B